MKRLIVISIISLLSLFATARPAVAGDVQTCVQVTQYGGGVNVVCSTKHEPVDTGLADINPLYLASTFFLFAGYGMYQYKKILRKEVVL